MTTDHDALASLPTPDDIRAALARRVREADVLRRLLRIAESTAIDLPEPAYITRLREIATDDSVAPHARAAIRAALDRYDARGTVA